MSKHIGKQTIRFERPPVIVSGASTVGPKEGEGPLSTYFDEIMRDALGGQTSWEKSESHMVEKTLKLAIRKARLEADDIDYILTGDLLNQSIASTFGVRKLHRPFFGLFGACSTMGEAMSLGAVLIDGGFANNVLAGASSHFCAAEKQFRFPLELGTQRSPASSWTVTGCGSVVISNNGVGPKITHITTGKIVDMGIKDTTNMGACMAPAAFDTIQKHFADTGRDAKYYDVIVTGDLGCVGKDLVITLMDKEGVNFGGNFTDCGIEIFDKQTQDTHAGGSGCGCSAATFAGYYLNRLNNRYINKILFVPTGALMSPTSSQQGESVPGIAHAVAIEN